LCGIFGCICSSAPRVIADGLKRLEYRGYDSVGIAVISGGRLLLEKDKGMIDPFVRRVDPSRISAEIGIGHTRWATHGAPCKENAHPHLDCTGTIAVAHNGVLENFLEIKEGLLKRGHRFASNTDTEVIPHLIEEGIRDGLSLKSATARAAKMIKGAMAIAVLSSALPDSIVCMKRESPLAIGIGKKGAYCASDVPALLPYTDMIMQLQDDQVAVISRGQVAVETIAGKPVKPRFIKIEWEAGVAEKGGYPHFMLKEMHEQPIAMRSTLKLPHGFLDRASRMMEGRVYLTGSGTSYHACLASSYAFSKMLCMDIRPVYSSEFQDLVCDLKGNTVIGVSQSGETADTLSALRYAKSKGAKVIGITNTLASSITSLSDTYICTQGGPEIGVAATKTFLTQLMALDQLMLSAGLSAGRLPECDASGLLAHLNGAPSLAEGVIRRSGAVRSIAQKYSSRRSAYFLARGINVATAMEGALKLKELSYMHAEGYPAGESKHGPISLVEGDFLCVFVAPRDSSRGRVIGNMMEMKARGARIFAVVTEGDDELKSIADDTFEVPPVPEFLNPVVCTIPLQALAYYVAVLRGLDPDKPRNLAKSVTVL
jgi:glucosamine--fructose-6-phosphate aminotransferase (isomerizing)